jgi:4a-hydroxytetrahydrobiopterin dehydratase
VVKVTVKGYVAGSPRVGRGHDRADIAGSKIRRYVVATRLSDVEVVRALADLDDWHGDCAAISRVVVLDDDKVTSFLADLELVAREMDHDPDIERAEGQLTIAMSTHSAGGVTELDVAYAQRVDALVTQLVERT